ncbi:MAG: DUF4261 domain-containing protein [Planctomycetota bacterium]
MISLLTFDSEEFPSLADLESTLRSHFQDLIEVTADEERATLEVQIGTERALVSPKRPSLPWGLLERPCKNAWYWPDAVSVMQRHTWHLVAVIKDSREKPVHRSLLLTRITACLGASLGYVGVYWDDATMVHSAADFTTAAAAADRANFPVKLWVNFRIVGNEDGSHTLFTTGLEPLGHMEIEIPRSSRSAPELERWAYNVAHYLIKDEEQIEDGETVGRSDTEKVRVRHVPSMFDSNRKVLFLEV